MSTSAATSGTPVHAETTSRVCHSVDVGSRFSDLTGLVPAFTSARRESLVEKKATTSRWVAYYFFKGAVPNAGRRRGAHLPFLGL